MASGESQGKTIALIIFVSLTAITGLSAHYFWDKYDRLTVEKAAAEKNAQKASQAQAEIDKSYGELGERVLGAGQRAHDEMMQTVNADLQSPKINETRLQTKPAYRSYSGAVQYLSKELAASDQRKLALLQNIDQLQVQLAALQQRYQLEVDEAESSKSAKEQELAAEKQKLEALVALKDQEISQYREQFGRADTELRQVERDMEDQELELNKRIANTRLLIEDASRSEQLRGQVQFERPDGSIVQSIPSLGQAYIDLGYEDNLFPGLTFSVFSSDVGGSPYRLPKANLEVVRVEPRRALVRVTNENTLQPILPGDLIYNPVWSKDHTAGVAFVGEMYVDDDDQHDNDFFASLVREAGGRIDAFVPDMQSGRIEGALTVETTWLVLGEIPEASESTYEQEKNQRHESLLRATDQMRNQAQANGVRVVNLRNFLTFMGLETPQRTVPAGAEEKFYFGKRRPRLVDTAPSPAIRSKNDTSSSN